MNINNDALVADMKNGGIATVNERTRVFCYTGGTPFMAIDAKKSGLPCNPITGGRLHQLNPKRQGYTGAYDPIKRMTPRLWSWDMPAQNAALLKQRFHESVDMGYRNLEMLTELPYSLTDVPTGEIGRDGKPVMKTIYEDEAYEYFDIVHQLPKSECKYGLNREIQFTDPGVGVSTPGWQFCPTCQLKELRSAECDARINNAIAQGKRPDILFALRERLIEACEASIAYAKGSFDAVSMEIQARRSGAATGRVAYNGIDQIHLRMLHKDMPKDENTQLIQQLVEGLSQSRTEVATAQAALTPDLIASIKADLKAELRAEMEQARQVETVAEPSVEESIEEIVEESPKKGKK